MWEKWIQDYLWNTAAIIQQRLEHNFNIYDPKFEVRNDIIDVQSSKPFVVTSTENYIVFQDYDKLDNEFQSLKIYSQNNEADIWTTETFGPIKEDDLKRKNKYWKKYVRVKALINDEILAISYECANLEGNNNLKVWSNISRKLIFDEYILSLSDILLDEGNSRIILIKERSIEVLKFDGNSLLRRKSCPNESLIRKKYPHNGVTSRVVAPNVVLWEPFCSTNKLHHWKMDLITDDIKMYRFIVDFNRFSTRGHLSILDEVMIKDGTFLNNMYIIVFERVRAGRHTYLHITNEEGVVFTKMLLFEGAYLTNCRIFVNEYRLILKAFRYIYEEVLMFDWKYLQKEEQTLDSRGFDHWNFGEFKTKNLSYRIYDHYYPEGGQNYGFSVTNTSIIRVSVIGDNYKMEKMNLNFLPDM